MPELETLTVFAPAKINLYLHVIARRDDGYHDLDSLIAFADIGDEISIEPHQDFEFGVTGPFGGELSDQSSNLVVRAAQALSQATNKDPNVKITLTKNLPLSAGIGGGSSDAAATLRGLCQFWGIPKTSAFSPKLLLELGADVPVCFTASPARVTAIGDEINPLTQFPTLPVVLINPLLPCPTAEVFKNNERFYDGDAFETPSLNTLKEALEFLKTTDNNLTTAAQKTVPAIATILSALNDTEGCALARMSGSGATCFGIFETDKQAQDAADSILKSYPEWWVRSGALITPA